MQEMRVQSLYQEDPLEKGMATHSDILVWEILWTEEPGGLQSTVSQRVQHDLATKQHQKEMFSLLHSIFRNLKRGIQYFSPLSWTGLSPLSPPCVSHVCMAPDATPLAVTQ